MVDDPRDGVDGVPVGRRAILGLLGLGALGVVAGKRVQDAISSALAPLELRDPTGILSLLPLGGVFRYYSVTGAVEPRDATTYRLDVTGLVARPMTLRLADLQAMRQTVVVRDFQCITGWRVPEVRWSGVRLADVLDAAGPSSTAKAVRLRSFDGTYTDSLPIEKARRSDVLVALTMFGKPVTHDHGGPVRLYVASDYGYKSVKWLSGIELTTEEVPGYWETRGYPLDATLSEADRNR